MFFVHEANVCKVMSNHLYLKLLTLSGIHLIRAPVIEPYSKFKIIILTECKGALIFFGKIQNWIIDLRSHGYFAHKETKNPKMDFCHDNAVNTF